MLTQEQFVQLMRQTQNGKTAKEFAGSLGISEQYLSDIYRYRRMPGEDVAAKMKFDRRVVFVPRKRR